MGWWYLCGYVLAEVSGCTRVVGHGRRLTMALSGMKRSPRTSTNLAVMFTGGFDQVARWNRECLAYLMTDMVRAFILLCMVMHTCVGRGYTKDICPIAGVFAFSSI